MTFSIVLLCLALVIALVTALWSIVLAFQRHVLWGLAVLFLPFANLVFLFVAWAEAKRPFLLSLLAIPFAAAGIYMFPKDRVAAYFNRGLNAPGFAAAAGIPQDSTSNGAAPGDPIINRLKAREAELLARKASLDPKDTAGAAALAKEIAEYNAELRTALPPTGTAKIGSAPGKSPASGQIAGRPFNVEQATVRNGILTLRQGKDFFADREISIFLFLKEGESPAGRKWTIPTAGQNMNPHVHFSWKDEEKGVPKTKIFMSDYQMQLEFDAAKDGKLTGRIALSTPADARSTVNGAFTAQIASAR